MEERHKLDLDRLEKRLTADIRIETNQRTVFEQEYRRDQTKRKENENLSFQPNSMIGDNHDEGGFLKSTNLL